MLTCSSTTLLADDGAAWDYFGESVSADANTMIVGAQGDDDGAIGAGSAYIYQLNESGEWIQQTKLGPKVPSQFLHFGSSTAISGDTALVGALLSNEVEVFVGTDGTWERETIFRGADDTFGHSLDIDGDTAVVGEPSGGGLQGKAYVVSFGCLWGWPQVLEAIGGQANDRFGECVAIHGNTIIVGAPGIAAAFVFVNTDGAWEFQGELTTEGSNWNYCSVAVHGDIAAVGFLDTGTPGTGAVYTFNRVQGVWQETSNVTAVDLEGEVGSGILNFGMRIALNDGALVVGSNFADNAQSSAYSNKAYVFEITSLGQLTFKRELDAGDGYNGWVIVRPSVAISGTAALVGAPVDYEGDDPAMNERVGVVHAFENCVGV